MRRCCGQAGAERSKDRGRLAIAETFIMRNDGGTICATPEKRVGTHR